MSGFSLYRITVKAAIIDGDRVLLLRRGFRSGKAKQGLWELAGGGVEKGESPDFSLRREVREETGLELAEMKPILIWNRSREEGEIIGITYLARAEGRDIKLSDEHIEYAWVRSDELENYTMMQGLIEELRQLERNGSFAFY